MTPNSLCILNERCIQVGFKEMIKEGKHGERLRILEKGVGTENILLNIGGVKNKSQDLTAI